VVTEAFNCAGTGFAVTLGKDFAADATFALEAAFEPALAAVSGGALLGDFSAVTFCFAPFALSAAAFFTAGLAAELAAAGFAIFAVKVRVFAGFFIAVAIESTTN